MSDSESGNELEPDEIGQEMAESPSGKGQSTISNGGSSVPKGSILDRDVDLSRGPQAGLEAELEVTKNEAKENYDKYLRALAELENYKKRVVKERSELVKYQGERVFLDILDVVDDLERALQYTESDPSQLKTGIEMIYKRFNDILSKWEVRGESAVGKKFDPNLHHALSKIKSPDAEPGTIVGELKKVFFYKDKVLRHGEVVVSDE